MSSLNSDQLQLVQEAYPVSLDIFEGPLDLLLYLIKKDELDIHDIPIGSITDQYLNYLKLMKVLDLNIAGDFIVMSATLMLIKSRMLLPEEERTSDDEEEDPRWDLVKQLVEYKKFKDASIFDLITALNDALGRVEEESLQEIFAEEFTVNEKINYIVETLKIAKQLSVTDLFCGMVSRHEIVCTFLAVLELMKSSKIVAVQKGNFGHIAIEIHQSLE